MVGGSGDRGQSSVMGTALLIGMVIGGAFTVVVIGGAVLTDIQTDVESGSAVQNLQQVSSQGSLVALSDHDRSQVSLSARQGSYRVDADAGTIAVYHIDDSGERRNISESRSLGAIVYENDETSVAFQGGGVWRANGEGSAMVSPPQYNYRRGTLTFPIIRVTGSGTASGNVDVALTDAGQTQLFPNEPFLNPVDNGTLYVEIESDYHDGWYQFLNSRSEGEPHHDPENQTVVVDLTVPFEETFDTSVAATAPCDEDPIEESGSEFDGPKDCGTNQPSPTDEIDSLLDDCKAGDCTELASGPIEDATLDENTYYIDGPVTFDDDVTFDTTDSEVNIVVDGDVTFTDSPPSSDQNHFIEGDNGVTLYTTGEITVDNDAETNTDRSASLLTLVVHTEGGDITLQPNSHFVGNIYAPNSHLDAVNNMELRGAFVINTAHVGGNVDHTYDGDIDDVLEFDDVENELTYLHVTDNELHAEIS